MRQGSCQGNQAGEPGMGESTVSVQCGQILGVGCRHQAVSLVWGGQWGTEPAWVFQGRRVLADSWSQAALGVDPGSAGGQEIPIPS